MSGLLSLRRTAVGLSAAVLALQGGVAATVCRAGRVEMIVGGTVPPTDCAARAAGRLPAMAAGAGAAAGGERIDPAVQRERDSDRRRILEDELAHEQAVLAGLLRQGPAADAAAVARSRANVAAVRQELVRTSP